jgi:hypothetical protein
MVAMATKQSKNFGTALGGNDHNDNYDNSTAAKITVNIGYG